VFPSESHATFYEFSEAELQAAVEEAKARGTYVMARAGVRSIEHASFVSKETVAMMSESGVYFDLTFISLVQRIESANETHLPEAIVSNLEQTVSKGGQVYEWAKQYGLPIAFGTDLWGVDARSKSVNTARAHPCCLRRAGDYSRRRSTA
jgi:imidazolonepropionase-like amidohydrolase